MPPEAPGRPFDDLLDALPAFVVGLDAAGRVVFWNRQLEVATGCSRTEMLGRPWDEPVDPGAAQPLATKSGAQRLVRWQSADDLPSSRPGVRYLLGNDVTDERSTLRRTLRAERLAAAGTLAAGLAHELRNPLNSAALQLQVLRRRLERGAAAADLTPVLALVEDEILRLDRLVSDFLALARPGPTELRRTELEHVLEAVVARIRTDAESKGVAVRVVVGATQAVHAAPEQLEQVLLNLARNAVEAMAEGGTLTLSTHPADDEGYVGISVEDTGPGFADDAPIFDAFYTTKPGGTGLGLTIAHRIVSEHGGSISAESRPGHTAFMIRLPRRA